MIIIIFFGIFFGLYLASVYKDVGTAGKLDDSTLTTAGAIGAVCNGSSRFVWASI